MRGRARGKKRSNFDWFRPVTQPRRLTKARDTLSDFRIEDSQRGAVCALYVLTVRKSGQWNTNFVFAAHQDSDSTKRAWTMKVTVQCSLCLGDRRRGKIMFEPTGTWVPISDDFLERLLPAFSGLSFRILFTKLTYPSPRMLRILNKDEDFGSSRSCIKFRKQAQESQEVRSRLSHLHLHIHSTVSIARMQWVFLSTK